MKRSHLFFALLGIAGSVSANTVTWDFANDKLLPQAISSPASFVADGQTLEVTSYYLNGGTWTSATTNQNVLGLGVTSGFLENPQLDNIGKLEILRMAFPDLGAPIQAQFKLAITSDDYTIWTNNTGAFPTTGKLIVGDILAQGQGIGLGTKTVNFNSGVEPLKYLFFAGLSTGGVLDTSGIRGGDGYRIKDVTAEIKDSGGQVVPIPAALPLFLSAIAGIGVMGRRRRAA